VCVCMSVERTNK